MRHLQKPILAISKNAIPGVLDEACLDPGLLGSLLNLLNGDNTIEQIIASLVIAGYDELEIAKLVTTLKDADLLRESPSSDLGVFHEEELKLFGEQIFALAQSADSDGSMFCSFPSSGLRAQARLKSASIAVVGDGDVTERLLLLLASIGIGSLVRYGRMTSQKDLKELIGAENPFASYSEVYRDAPLRDLIADINTNATVIVYADRVFDHDLCELLNRTCIARGCDFLMYRRDRMNVEVGPLVKPRMTACYRCFSARVAGASSGVQHGREMNASPSMRLNIGLEAIVTDLLKHIAKIGEPTVLGRVWRFDLLAGRSETHEVYKLPRCPDCGVHRVKPERKLWEAM